MKSKPKTLLMAGTEASAEEIVNKMREKRKFGKFPATELCICLF
jgi:hypothetical protein